MSLFYLNDSGWHESENFGGPIKPGVSSLGVVNGIPNLGTGGQLYYLGSSGWSKSENYPSEAGALTIGHDMVGSYQGIYQLGSTWSLMPGSPTCVINSIQKIGNSFYAATEDGLYEKTGTRTWAPVEGTNDYEAFCIEEVEGMLNFGTKDGIVFFNTKTQTWQQAQNMPKHKVYCIGLLGETYNAGTSDGIYYLDKNGWQKAGNFNSSANVYCFEEVNGFYNAGTEDGLFYLDKNGWQKAENFPSGGRVRCIANLNGTFNAGVEHGAT